MLYTLTYWNHCAAAIFARSVRSTKTHTTPGRTSLANVMIVATFGVSVSPDGAARGSLNGLPLTLALTNVTDQSALYKVLVYKSHEKQELTEKRHASVRASRTNSLLIYRRGKPHKKKQQGNKVLFPQTHSFSKT